MTHFLFRALLTASLLIANIVHAAERPNIVLFLTDDMGWGDLGCYGHEVIQTPHLDYFAKQGMRLRQCYAGSAVCSPSRSALLTGRTPHRNGVYTWIAEGSEVHLPTSEVTLPEVLRENGYDTCHAGKWHLNGMFADPFQPQPSEHGYNWWLGTQNNAAPSHKNPTNFVRNGKAVGPVEGYSAIFVVEEAIAWLKQHRDPAKPFFLTVWTHEPHLPIESDPRFQKPYEKLSDPDVRQHHGNISQVDYAFGKLMDALAEQRLSDDTLVVFTSDNGPEGDGTQKRTRGSTGGLRGRKRALYEGGIRVPGIIRWPRRIAENSSTSVPVIGSDMFPTLLAAAGVTIPTSRKLDGTNVLPLLLGETQTVERKSPLYWRLHMATFGLHKALRDGDWKILASDDFQRFELYNIAQDPQETTELSEKEPEKLAALKQKLLAYDAEVEAEGPDWWKRLTPNGGKPRTSTQRKQGK